MASSVRARVLGPSDRATSSSDHLGIYIVKEIVRKHGGRIELKSDESATVFHIWLPKRHGD
jgi:signal transduction histidine kinase